MIISRVLFLLLVCPMITSCTHSKEVRQTYDHKHGKDARYKVGDLPFKRMPLTNLIRRAEVRFVAEEAWLQENLIVRLDALLYEKCGSKDRPHYESCSNDEKNQEAILNLALEIRNNYIRGKIVNEFSELYDLHRLPGLYQALEQNEVFRFVPHKVFNDEALFYVLLCPRKTIDSETRECALYEDRAFYIRRNEKDRLHQFAYFFIEPTSPVMKSKLVMAEILEIRSETEILNRWRQSPLLSGLVATLKLEQTTALLALSAIGRTCLLFFDLKNGHIDLVTEDKQREKCFSDSTLGF